MRPNIVDRVHAPIQWCRIDISGNSAIQMNDMNFNDPMSIVSVSSLLTHSQRSRQPPSATIRQRISPLNADLLRNYFLQLSHSQSPCDPNEPM